MENMWVIGFVFGIFGLLAYIQVSPLKKRVADLERELTRMQGTSFNADRSSLIDAARGCAGRQVKLELKEDNQDADVVSYGNTKHGANTILDIDDEWLLVRTTTPKGTKEKLLRLESIARITVDAKDTQSAQKAKDTEDAALAASLAAATCPQS